MRGNGFLPFTNRCIVPALWIISTETAICRDGARGDLLPHALRQMITIEHFRLGDSTPAVVLVDETSPFHVAISRLRSRHHHQDRTSPITTSPTTIKGLSSVQCQHTIIHPCGGLCIKQRLEPAPSGPRAGCSGPSCSRKPELQRHAIDIGDCITDKADSCVIMRRFIASRLEILASGEGRHSP